MGIKNNRIKDTKKGDDNIKDTSKMGDGMKDI